MQKGEGYKHQPRNRGHCRPQGSALGRNQQSVLLEISVVLLRTPCSFHRRRPHNGGWCGLQWPATQQTPAASATEVTNSHPQHGLFGGEIMLCPFPEVLHCPRTRVASFPNSVHALDLCGHHALDPSSVVTVCLCISYRVPL